MQKGLSFDESFKRIRIIVQKTLRTYLPPHPAPYSVNIRKRVRYKNKHKRYPRKNCTLALNTDNWRFCKRVCVTTPLAAIHFIDVKTTEKLNFLQKKQNEQKDDYYS